MRTFVPTRRNTITPRVLSTQAAASCATSRAAHNDDSSSSLSPPPPSAPPPSASGTPRLTAFRPIRRFSEPFNAERRSLAAATQIQGGSAQEKAHNRPAALRIIDHTADAAAADIIEANAPPHLAASTTSPRDFQAAYEKRNTRFFPNFSSSSWRNSTILDDKPIEEEELDEDDEQPPSNYHHTSACIQISAPRSRAV